MGWVGWGFLQALSAHLLACCSPQVDNADLARLKGSALALIEEGQVLHTVQPPHTCTCTRLCPYVVKAAAIVRPLHPVTR